MKTNNDWLDEADEYYWTRFERDTELMESDIMVLHRMKVNDLKLDAINDSIRIAELLIEVQEFHKYWVQAAYLERNKQKVDYSKYPELDIDAK